MIRNMFTFDEVVKKIGENKRLILAGDEKLLSKLPAGNWMGGTIPYFMGDEGGMFSKEKISVTELPEYVENFDVKVYDKETIKNVYNDAPENGFSLMLIPKYDDLLLDFAINVPMYENFAMKPLLGWVTGMSLEDENHDKPKVYLSNTGYTDKAIVLHAVLPKNKVAEIGLINIFEQGNGDEIEFFDNGFSAKEVLVNGIKTGFGEYMEKNNIDPRFLFVADYMGVMINIGIVEKKYTKGDTVEFFAPVFKGIKYKYCKPMVSYVDQFLPMMPTDKADDIVFSCNCLKNYLHGGLVGKKTGGIKGPVTFGEIVYQLVNQTLVYLTIQDI